MFEPEYQNIACPRCHYREVYFDRETGFYCMFCGREFGIDEMRLLIDTEVLRTPRTLESVDGGQMTEGDAQRRRTIWGRLGTTLSQLFMNGRHQL